jgi:hypothetical protein
VAWEAWTTPITWLTGFSNRATAAKMNQQLRGNMNYLYRTSARKGSDQNYTTTTFGDDTDMAIPMLASEKYIFEAVIFYNAPTAGDIKIAWTVPASATGAWGAMGRDPTTTTNLNAVSFSAFGDANTASFGGTAANETIFVNGGVVNSSTPGNLQLRVAQLTASGTTIVRASSLIIAHRVI